MAFVIKHVKGKIAALEVLAGEIRNALNQSRFTAEVRVKPNRIEIGGYDGGVRLREKKGYCGNHPNACVLQRKHKTMNYLEGADWVGFNDMLNDVLDNLKISADVASTHVIIRKGPARCIEYTSHPLGGFGHFDWDKDSGQFRDRRGRKSKPSKYPYGTPGIPEWRNDYDRAKYPDHED